MSAGRLPVPAARVAYPAAIAALGAAWYASGSLRHRREQGSGYELGTPAPPVGDRAFLRTAEALTAAPISTGDEIELLINGEEIFPAFLETIRSAKRTLNLLTYVYWRGDIATEVADALCAKAREGVEVNVLLDWIGTVKMDPAIIDELRECGATVAKFRPPKPYAIRRLDNRTHRKLLVADGEVGMTGGVGIADEWTGNAQDPDHWRDTHVRVRGPVVRGLQGAFIENWLEATGTVLVGEDHLPDLDARAEGSMAMQVVRSQAGVGDTNVEALMFLAIAAAQKTLDLTAAYFAPRPAFTNALCEAADRGVRVRVLVPGPHADKQLVRATGQETYAELVDCGVEVHEYQPTMLHAKTLVVDGAWSSVGSVNFDNRSFQLQDEATLCVQDDAFAADLTAQFERDLERAERIRPGAWARRPLRQRALERGLRLIRREL
ncbi:phospholipase D-like domain-containing protein [Paraconexibacter antarcticus]|uniref:Phospholipase D-like domain-containing protein n=1 Tax=Paraconexibacter antarcticus TaxID=2949664 RepID=A0ABY5DR26_9ACTN|nr:phospholipase D-like domain-containing protein [Paraconexibacter antarcticus]UTI64490.1 phospholipase D-like domain-containing protein [Paraconexibacter antarcticus]